MANFYIRDLLLEIFIEVTQRGLCIRGTRLSLTRYSSSIRDPVAVSSHTTDCAQTNKRAVLTRHLYAAPPQWSAGILKKASDNTLLLGRQIFDDGLQISNVGFFAITTQVKHASKKVFPLNAPKMGNC